jgi:nicotinamidase-related amidase
MSASPRRALLVIDAQNEYVTGNLPIEYPDIQYSLANIGRAMDAAQLAGVPVVIVQQSSPAGSPVFSRGSPTWELHAVVADRPRSHYIEKTLPSAFAGTDLAEWLGLHGIDTLVVTGYMTHNCDDSTVKHALHTGLVVEFLADATGSLPYENRAGRATAEEIHRAFTVVMQSRFAAVATTDEWIAALRAGEPLSGDNIYLSNRRARGLAKSA